MSNALARFARLQGLGLAGQEAILGSIALAAWLVFAPLAAHLSGAAGFASSGVAMACCWLGNAAALGIAGSFKAQSLGRLLLPIPIRMGVPLLAAAACYAQARWLVQAGLLYYLVAFYLLLLIVETALLLPRRSERQRDGVSDRS
jgi:hypothetical protein